MATERELDMFGCDPKDFLESVKDSITYQITGKRMVLMSLMSDAQEEIAVGLKEQARKTLNRAKYLLTELPD